MDILVTLRDKRHSLIQVAFKTLLVCKDQIIL